MYTNAGNKEIIKNRRIIGIFDLETASFEKATRDWLAVSEKDGRIFYHGTELPLSVILADQSEHKRAKNHRETVLILSQFTPKTLAKRSGLTLEQLRGETV